MKVWRWEGAIVNTRGSQCQEAGATFRYAPAKRVRTGTYMGCHGQCSFIRSHGSQQPTADAAPTSRHCFHLRLDSQLLIATSSVDVNRCSISSCHLGTSPLHSSIQVSKKIRTIGALGECLGSPKAHKAQAHCVSSQCQDLPHLHFHS
jgi:hypothetical protein